MRTLWIAFIFVAHSTAALFAQSLEDSDQRQIAGLAAMFDAAFEANDMAAVIGFMPEPIIAYIAEQGGLRPLTLRHMLVQQTQEMMETVEVEHFNMDVDAMETAVTPTGRAYALVPTTSTISMNGQRFETMTKTLFFEDQGNWFLLRIENASQIHILNAVYPDFASVSLL
ncbi:hypothetical protein Q4555_04770 [Octadecabacter sp. 1_MG-2023]|uniref:hypothetical protein n=1 Tax=unclassified Octadecabacter TaxID=196158 RepID=UPI001C08C9EE|nr:MULTISPECIES: hypothetical protein [unclassified Octadecabacter]MBU2994739.1 hypothetical protein [Octadecabacter sp. B2R22]MDO6733967.1 hypothetical protein [Octadecabacter sp. 1_MG-2023]